MRTAMRFGLVLLTVAVIQRGIVSQMRIDGVTADLMVLLAVAGGIVGGPDRGAKVGFFAGLTLDLLTQTPIGLAALAYCLAGYGAGMAHAAVVRATWWEPRVLAAGASAGGVVLYVLISVVVGRSGMVNGHLVAVVLVVAAVNALLVPVAIRAIRWAFEDGPVTRAALR